MNNKDPFFQESEDDRYFWSTFQSMIMKKNTRKYESYKKPYNNLTRLSKIKILISQSME